jgi:DNA invertase Pin-like site-specific DNA recombinase
VHRAFDDRAFEADLALARTPAGMAVAKARGRLRGKRRKLKTGQEKHLVQLWNDGTHTTAQLADLFNVGRSTVYRAIRRFGLTEKGSHNPAPNPRPTESSFWSLK